MVKTCCVKNCNIESDRNITCFRFPNSRLLKRQWIDAIGLSSKLTANSMICIRHFQEDDYDIVRGRPRLKARVIPSVFSEPGKKSQEDELDFEDNSVGSFTDSYINIINSNDKVQAVSSSPEDSQNLNKEDKQTTDKTDESVQDNERKDIERKGENDEGLERKVDGENDVERKVGDEKDLERNADSDKGLEKKVDSDKNLERTFDNDKDLEIKGDGENGKERKDDVKKDKERKDDVKKDKERKDHVKKVKKRKVNREKGKKRKVNGEKDKKRKAYNEKDKVRKTNKLDKDTDSLEDEDSDESDDSITRKDIDNGDKTKKSKPNGVICNDSLENDALVKSTPLTSSGLDDLNKDIEDIITNYQIKQTRPLHALDLGRGGDEGGAGEGEAEGEAGECVDVDEVPEVARSDPVFIEVSVQGKGDRAGSPRDCLMVLESVQVELDPSAFLTADGQHPDHDCHETVDLDDEEEPAGSPQDPISLLTSSDEDEVIIQEPHIDTVEVSDETDEDDLPLVKLLKRSKKKEKAIWKTFFYCMVCQYTTSDSTEYQEHVSKHSTVLHVCEICDYTTASKTQFARHKRKHKDDKKYKCHLCDYKARHNMSLIYHLKSHKAVSSAKKGFKCDKCGFKSEAKSVVLKHVRLCSANVKQYSCGKCAYKTKRASDLRRHFATRRCREEDDVT